MVDRKKFNVLFVCTGNSARSILAEALLNQPIINRGHFNAFSAGTEPQGEVSAHALDVLKRHHIRAKGLRSKSWEEFAGSDSPAMDFVITVCDQAAKEQHPYWPGHPMTTHWGVPDPVALQGSDEDKRRAFRNAFLLLKRRIELFSSLPLDKLDRLSLRERMKAIGADPGPSKANPGGANEAYL